MITVRCPIGRPPRPCVFDPSSCAVYVVLFEIRRSCVCRVVRDPPILELAMGLEPVTC